MEELRERFARNVLIDPVEGLAEPRARCAIELRDRLAQILQRPFEIDALRVEEALALLQLRHLAERGDVDFAHRGEALPELRQALVGRAGVGDDRRPVALGGRLVGGERSIALAQRRFQVLDRQAALGRLELESAGAAPQLVELGLRAR